MRAASHEIPPHHVHGMMLSANPETLGAWRPRREVPISSAGVTMSDSAARMIDLGMFRSDRVEFMAIPLMVVLLGALFVVFAVAEIGVWAWILTGVVILAAILLLVWRVAERHRHPPAADAPRPAEQPRPAGAHRILVVADQSCHPARSGRRSQRAPPDARPRHSSSLPRPALAWIASRETKPDTRMRRATSKRRSRSSPSFATLTSSAGRSARTTRSRSPTRPCASSGGEIVFAVDAGASKFLEEEEIERRRSRYSVPVPRVVAAPTGPRRAHQVSRACTTAEGDSVGSVCRHCARPSAWRRTRRGPPATRRLGAGPRRQRDDLVHRDRDLPAGG